MSIKDAKNARNGCCNESQKEPKSRLENESKTGRYIELKEDHKMGLNRFEKWSKIRLEMLPIKGV